MHRLLVECLTTCSLLRSTLLLCQGHPDGGFERLHVATGADQRQRPDNGNQQVRSSRRHRRHIEHAQRSHLHLRWDARHHRRTGYVVTVIVMPRDNLYRSYAMPLAHGIYMSTPIHVATTGDL
jgi:hypothetical protein